MCRRFCSNYCLSFSYHLASSASTNLLANTLASAIPTPHVIAVFAKQSPADYGFLLSKLEIASVAALLRNDIGLGGAHDQHLLSLRENYHLGFQTAAVDTQFIMEKARTRMGNHPTSSNTYWYINRWREAVATVYADDLIAFRRYAGERILVVPGAFQLGRIHV